MLRISLSFLYGQWFLKGQFSLVTWPVHEISLHPCMERVLIWRCRSYSSVLSSSEILCDLYHWYLNASYQRHKWKSKRCFQAGKLSNSWDTAVKNKKKLIFYIRLPVAVTLTVNLYFKQLTATLRRCKYDYIHTFNWFSISPLYFPFHLIWSFKKHLPL